AAAWLELRRGPCRSRTADASPQPPSGSGLLAAPGGLPRETAREAPRGPICAMAHVFLHEPAIAGTTGNAIRLSAVTGARLHLIEPLGFDLEDAKLRRAGLDYHDLADVRI